MSRESRILNKIKRLDKKVANLEFKIDNLKAEYNYWIAMEDDSEDWKDYEDYD